MLQIQNQSTSLILGAVLVVMMSMSTVSAGWVWKPAGMGGMNPGNGMTGMHYAPGMSGMYRIPGMAGMRGTYRPRGMSGMSLMPGMTGMRGMHGMQGMNPGKGGRFKIVEKTWTPPCN